MVVEAISGCNGALDEDRLAAEMIYGCDGIDGAVNEGVVMVDMIGGRSMVL